jgi:hypothetical protein
LQEDIRKGDFDVGYFQNYSVVTLRSPEDIQEIWSSLSKGTNFTKVTLWCDGSSSRSSRKRKKQDDSEDDDSGAECSSKSRKKTKDEEKDKEIQKLIERLKSTHCLSHSQVKTYTQHVHQTQIQWFIALRK